MALQDRAQTEEAAIPVENIQGAILLVSAKRDALWPSTPMSEQIEKRLAANGFEHHCEHMAVDTNHFGIMVNKDCWRKVFEFLRENYAVVNFN